MGLESAVDLDAVASALLEQAKRAGADAADAVVTQGESLSVSARNGSLEEAERAESIDFGLRVLIGAEGGHRQAMVSASDPAADALAELAERAVAMARAAPADPYARLAAPEQTIVSPPDLELVDPSEPPAPEALFETALALEEAAMAVEGVRQCEGAGAGWRRGRVVMATSAGFHQGYGSSSHSISVSALAGEGLGMERDYDYSAARWREDLRSPEAVGREAGERAVRRLGPRKPKTGRYPVVYEPRMASGLVGAILGAANGASVARGSSFLREKMGERILPAGFDVIDDPLKPRGMGSRPFDGDGLPGAAKRVVADGVLSLWLLDLASAAQLGLESNGSAGRGVGGAPSPSASNAWLTPGAQTPEELIGAIEEGLFVTEMMGRGFNPVTGDYSRGASGFWIEKGEIAYPVSELTVAGRFDDLLDGLSAANDLEFERRVNAPTLRVEGMTVAAE